MTHANAYRCVRSDTGKFGVDHNPMGARHPRSKRARGPAGACVRGPVFGDVEYDVAITSCYLSHHTLPLMVTLVCAALAASRFAPFSELSTAGYGNRVGTVFVLANGPGTSTG